MWHPARSIAAMLIAWPLAAVAADRPDTPDPAEARLLAAEDARFRAVLAHDAATLERALASELTYSHMTGKRENKSQVMQGAMLAGFSAIEPSDRSARVIGDIGIIRGIVARRLPDRVLADGYLAVYTLREGRWQLLEWVSANPPPPPEPAK
jgi:hypothetical protein